MELDEMKSLQLQTRNRHHTQYSLSKMLGIQESKTRTEREISDIIWFIPPLQRPLLSRRLAESAKRAQIHEETKHVTGSTKKSIRCVTNQWSCGNGILIIWLAKGSRSWRSQMNVRVHDFEVSAMILYVLALILRGRARG